MSKTKRAFETDAIHSGEQIDKLTGAVIPPISVSTTYAFKSIGKTRKYVYSRSQNPSRDTLETKLAALEGSKYTLTFASGMAAVHAATSILQAGDTVICVDNCYGGTHELFTRFLKIYKIKVHFMDFADLGKVESEIKRLRPRILWLESPTNPLMKIYDIAKVSSTGKKYSCLTAVDNTFSGPYIQKPLELGADVSVYSGTKYIGGHSDLSLGAVMTNSYKIYRKVKLCQHAVGGIPGALEVFLANRSLKTLLLRIKKQSENAARLVNFLSRHPMVRKVYYPSLDKKGFKLAKKQMKFFGGVFAFELAASVKKISKFIGRLELFVFAASLGAVESLIAHPVTMTHETLSKKELEKIGIRENLIRISCGVEDPDDLIRDLSNALESL